DEGRGVFVETDADRERIEGERGEQATDAITLAEMLVDDETIGQTQAGRQAHAAGDRRRAFLAERDHVFADEAGAGAGAGDVHAFGIALTDELGDRRAADDRRQAQLVAAGHEDAAGLGDALLPRFLVAVAAG